MVIFFRNFVTLLAVISPEIHGIPNPRREITPSSGGGLRLEWNRPPRRIQPAANARPSSDTVPSRIGKRKSSISYCNVMTRRQEVQSSMESGKLPYT